MSAPMSPSCCFSSSMNSTLRRLRVGTFFAVRFDALQVVDHRVQVGPAFQSSFSMTMKSFEKSRWPGLEEASYCPPLSNG
jgi:hypothetical protein